jgi:ectoine hydroxylase-related dioxygenase (phytanoyl-CoA dioxygenase family)
MSSNVFDYARLAADFRRDGAVLLRGVLDSADLQRAHEAFAWSIAHPTSAVQYFYPDKGATFFQDSYNTASWPIYRRLIEGGALCGAVSRVLDTHEMWFYFEQIFLKEGGECRRTPWHQDAPYLPVDGAQIAVAWMSLDPVSKADALEFVRASHRGTLFNGTSFDPNDDTAPVFDEKVLPRLPDIEGNRAAWDIISWQTEPGDVILFHPAVLHGGAPTHPHTRRRTISLRFIGDDVTFVERPQVMGAADVGYNEDGSPKRDMSNLYAQLKPGDKFRHPDLVRLL